MNRFLVPLTLLLAALLPAGPADAGCQNAVKIAAHLQALGPWRPIPVCIENAPGPLVCPGGNGGEAIQSQGAVGTGYALYVVAIDLDPELGVDQIGFSIDYDGTPGAGVDLFGTLTCGSALTVPENGFPASGGGVIVDFGACQGTDPNPSSVRSQVTAAAFYVYAYGDDRFSIDERPYSGLGKAFVRDCEGDVTPSGVLSSVGFGSTEGYPPCSADFYEEPQRCCLGTDCLWMEPACCMAIGGTPRSFNSCNVCQENPVPVLPTSWGRIKARSDQ